jgi:hypothetical protein
MKILYFVSMLVLCLGGCYASDGGELYVYKPDQPIRTLSVPLLVEALRTRPTVKKLDLSDREEVNDNFIEQLNQYDAFRTIVNIDLSHTRITERALTHIRGGLIGTRRELPQISERYSAPVSDVYLDVSHTAADSHKDLFRDPVAGVTIEYGRSVGEGRFLPIDGVPPRVVGIKRLEFLSKTPKIGVASVTGTFALREIRREGS